MVMLQGGGHLGYDTAESPTPQGGLYSNGSAPPYSVSGPAWSGSPQPGEAYVFHQSPGLSGGAGLPSGATPYHYSADTWSLEDGYDSGKQHAAHAMAARAGLWREPPPTRCCFSVAGRARPGHEGVRQLRRSAHPAVAARHERQLPVQCLRPVQPGQRRQPAARPAHHQEDRPGRGRR